MPMGYTPAVARRLFRPSARARLLWFFAAAVAELFGQLPSARAIGPDSPRVKEAIQRGIQYLETARDDRLGGKALIGLTFLKYGANHDHPQIAQAAQAISAAARAAPDTFDTDIYSTGISILFLVALDPAQYRSEIEILVRSLHRKQKEDGAWGYPSGDFVRQCDTSMTQYAVLGLWEAEDVAGVETPLSVWERVAEWLIRTQDPKGGFGYQGVRSRDLDRRVDQQGVKHSMTAAALGALYIMRDRLGIRQLKKPPDDDTPEALQPFESREDRQERIRTRIELRLFARAISDGERWMEANYELTKLPDWIYYSIYAYERYRSLREADERGFAPEIAGENAPAWYEDGARYLLDNQKADGSWESHAGPVPDTCFALLFLLRSTKKSLESASVARSAAGRMLAGRGLPETAAVRVRAGRVVVEPLAAGVEEILQAAADPLDPRHAAAVEAVADWSRTGDLEPLRPHIPALERVALQGDPEVRALAVAVRARFGDVGCAPLLIHALQDPAEEVVLAADAALRRLSRRSAAALQPGAGPGDVQAAVAQWKAWYREIDPSANLEQYVPAAP